MPMTKLTLYQHSWKAKDYDPDGAAYGTEAEADAAEVRAARELIGDSDGEGFSGDDLADAINQHTSADDVSEEREAEIRAGAELTDAEAVMAAEELCGFESAVYAITVDIDPAALPLYPTLQTGVENAFAVLANWARGDLASAVNVLRTWAESVCDLYPQMEVERPMRAEDLKPGDRVDLGDILTDDPAADFEYGRVLVVERETPDCIRVDFENGFDSYGFDPASQVMVIRTPDDLATYAALSVELMEDPDEVFDAIKALRDDRDESELDADETAQLARLRARWDQLTANRSN